MPNVRINYKNRVLQNFQASLSELGERDARKLLSMAVNKVGRAAYVQVKRDLRDVTGIAYDTINTSVKEHKASPANMAYSITAGHQSTNLVQFKPRAGKTQFSAAPWNLRRVFPRTFQPGLPGANPHATVFHRIGEKIPGQKQGIKPSFGPDLSREMLKPVIEKKWRIAAKGVVPEISRLMKLKMARLGPFLGAAE